LSQTALATRLGVSQKYVSHLERGKSTLQLGLVLRVLRELGVTLRLEIDAAEKPAAASRKSKGPKISIDQIVDG
jgi:transcriptional regulator with XRE-family HTH domain